jgi:hypothetical protein
MPVPTAFSRRGFLLAAAAVAVPSQACGSAAAAEAASPADAAECTPSRDAPGDMHAAGTLGTVTAMVNVKLLKDVVAMRYQLENIGTAPGTYVVSYTDTVTTFDSRAVTYTLEPRGKLTGVFYGTIDHKFLFYVGLSDGSTLTLGPLNRAPHCAMNGRSPRPPLYQAAGRRHHTR